MCSDNGETSIILCILLLRLWKGGAPVSHIPLIILTKKYLIIWQISPKFRKHCMDISLKLIQVSYITLNIYKNILYPFKFIANTPVSLKTLPRLSLLRKLQMHVSLCGYRLNSNSSDNVVNFLQIKQSMV